MTQKILYNDLTRLPELIIEVEMKRAWKVVGKCVRCGRCCLMGKAPYPEFEDPKTGLCTKLQFFDLDGKMVSRCLVNDNKPIGCAFFPSDPFTPNSIPKECLLRLIEVDFESVH